MTQPRRAADTSVEVTMESHAPRRGRAGGSFTRMVQRAVAPLAVISLVAATTVLTFLPIDERGTDVADPLLHAEVEMGVSRHRERAPLADVPTASPTPTLTRSPVAAASSEAPVVESSIPASPAASPTPSPELAETSVTPTPDPVEDPVPAVPEPVAEAPTEPAAAAADAEPATEVDHSALSAEAGTRYATSSVNVRSGPGTDFDVISSVADGGAVTITETSSDGWQQVSLDEDAGWIKATFLSETEPERTGSAASGASGHDTSSCSKASGIEGGLTSRTVTVLRAVCNAFPNVSSYGGYRGGGGSYHSSGRAIDVMVSGQAGWEIANWVRANASSLGVIEVIYSQKIWTSQRSGDGWRGMSNRGSASANHYDHVHISVR